MSWQRIKGLMEQRGEVLKQMQTLLSTAENFETRDGSGNKGRDLTPEETAKFDELSKNSERLAVKIGQENAVYAGTNEMRELVEPGNGGRPGRDAISNLESRTSIAFGLEKRFADVVPGAKQNANEARLSMQKFLRGCATGSWEGADLERRAMSEGVSSAGGVLVPTPLSGTIIDVARNKARVMQAGALTVPMEASTLKIARATNDVTAAWRAEGAALSATTRAFDSVTLTAKSLGGTVALTMELLDDAKNVDQVVIDSISNAVSLEIDRACLMGSGSSNQPTGIQNTSGIQTITAVGAPTSYAKWSNANTLIQTVNGTPSAVLLSPRTAGELDLLVDSLGQPLRMPPSLEELPFLPTAQIPNNLGGGTNESLSFVGDFHQVLLGIRNNLVIEMSREGADPNGLGFATGHILLRFWIRADVQIAHPNQFVLMSGIL